MFKILHQLTGTAECKGLIGLHPYNFFSSIDFLGFQMTWISRKIAQQWALLNVCMLHVGQIVKPVTLMVPLVPGWCQALQ